MILGFAFQVSALRFGPIVLLVLGMALGISWGFVATVIKALSSHLGDGIGAVFSNWSPSVLVAVSAATMLLASRALAVGPLAASQPGFTIVDRSRPACWDCSCSASTSRPVLDLAGEALALSSSSPVSRSSATAP